jgi:hypothetical protein
VGLFCYIRGGVCVGRIHVPLKQLIITMSMSSFDKEKISFNAPFQIINMGGPWVGQLYYGKVEIA